MSAKYLRDDGGFAKPRSPETIAEFNLAIEEFNRAQSNVKRLWDAGVLRNRNGCCVPR